MTAATAQKSTFEPVEFWNAVNPNQRIVVRDPEAARQKNYDPAGERQLRFLAGYFRATEPWQVEVIERELAGIAHRADSPTEWICQKCGWGTKSQKAFSHHIAQHA